MDRSSYKIFGVYVVNLTKKINYRKYNIYNVMYFLRMKKYGSKQTCFDQLTYRNNILHFSVG